ncbi:MAG: 4-oxalocrotonate tautomerase [Rhodospirillaceae bacterium]|nr:4-oxalocrotonate tautomerase [Rhodospirillaceae bacterium]
MPSIRVSMLSGKTKEQKAKLVSAIVNAFDDMGVPAAAVTTIFEEVSAEEWYIATESIAEKRENT